MYLVRATSTWNNIFYQSFITGHNAELIRRVMVVEDGDKEKRLHNHHSHTKYGCAVSRGTRHYNVSALTPSASYPVTGPTPPAPSSDPS